MRDQSLPPEICPDKCLKKSCTMAIWAKIVLAAKRIQEQISVSV